MVMNIEKKTTLGNNCQIITQYTFYDREHNVSKKSLTSDSIQMNLQINGLLTCAQSNYWKSQQNA
jgi:hypothetical protein